MTTMHAEPYISVLGKEESLLLLASTPVAWVAYCHGTRPLLVPANVVLVDGEVVFRTGYGDKLAAAARGQLLTVAASAIDARDRTGWSVTVTGRGRVLDEHVVLPDARLDGLAPWAPGEKDFYVGVPATDVSGRRIHRPR